MAATPAQVALAWLMAQKPWIVPIPGTTKSRRVKENADAVDLKLTSDDVERIRQAVNKIPVTGARYPEAMEKMTGL